ncbi:putative glutathione S-transferase theta-1 isoform X3 [Apostichopus japonicus]|uniref:Putative glutathione S-transferase theta-1 isoform X3 n=1 Tax=Stichopus japonicus TaxID=307972 RepID=A0A2G8K914_STIJA|nr:putative glutathione S-transferase theta-1 isoform X3 [Apostichopus japonicus]
MHTSLYFIASKASESFQKSSFRISAPEIYSKEVENYQEMPSRAVLIMCRVNNLNFTPCPIAMRKLEQKSPEFTKVNPFQRVPAIQDGDFSLTESGHNTLQTGIPADEESLQRQWKNVMKAFTAVEDYFLKDQPYIGGDQITIADLLGTCEVMQTAGVDPDFTKDHPKMKAWIQRVRHETNPHFDDTHKMIYKLGKISDPGKL